MGKMLAGYANFPGYGNTPLGGVTGFEELFEKGIPLLSDSDISKIDALILWGGGDIGTSLYNQEPYNTYQSKNTTLRDQVEWELMRRCYKKGIPMIGVCRGAQIMCAFAGGKLAQDIGGHLQSHDVRTYDGKTFYRVTSAHHQMMFPYAVDHQILATVDKNRSQEYHGLEVKEKELFKTGEMLEPEVVFFPEIKALGIQGHPEWEHHNFQQKQYNTWIHGEILQRLYGEVKV